MPLRGDLSIVLGADGFIGRNLMRYFAERGWPAYAIGRAAGDMAEPGVADRALAAAPKAARIFHVVTRQRTGPVQYGIQGELLAINARIHLNVLEAWRLRQPGAKLICAGSSCAYPEFDRPIAETDFLTGLTHPSVRGYAMAKQLLAAGLDGYAKQYGLSFLNCVLATVYGPGENKLPDRAHFMAGMIDRAVRQKRQGAAQFTVWGAPDTVRDLLYVDDQIAAMLAADRHFANAMVNCTANRPLTIDDAAKAILAVLKWDARITYPPDSFRGASYKTLDSARFLKATNWSPTVGLENGIAMVLAADYGIAG